MPDSLSAWYVTQIRAIERASTALRAIGRRSIRESMAGLKRGLSATHAAAGGRQRARAAQPGWRTTKSLRPKKNPVIRFVFVTPISLSILENRGSVNTQRNLLVADSARGRESAGAKDRVDDELILGHVQDQCGNNERVLQERIDGNPRAV